MSSVFTNIENKEKMSSTNPSPTSTSDLTDLFVLLKLKITTTNESFKEVKQLIEFIDTAIDDQRSQLDKQRTELDDHKTKLDKLKKLFLNYSIESTPRANDEPTCIDCFDPSSIITSDQKKELNLLCNFSPTTRWVLAYRATKDGFAAKRFHEKCDGVPKTLTIVKTSNSYIFGGYAQEPWDQSGEYIYDKNAFVFSLINKKQAPIRIPCTNPATAITSHRHSGPTFGDGHAFYLSDQSNIPANKELNQKLLSCSNLGTTYKHPLFSYNSHDAKTFLTGSFLFQTAEIEVFYAQ